MAKLKVLVVGCGNMGTSHARAYHAIEEFEVVGLVSRSPESRNRLSAELDNAPTYSNYLEALELTKPNIVSINTYPDTHYEYVKAALNANTHVFVEKPLATTAEDAQELVDLALKKNRKMVIGYILRVHPAWAKFVELAQGLGKPLAMRMNLNQQSDGEQWYTHKQLLQSLSPIVDCGVHYLDIMCLMTESVPVSVSAIGVNLTPEIPAEQYNYGQLQVKFADGSVGWYEAGWGPMMSETAFFVKDVIGPKGSVSIKDDIKDDSKDIEGHTKTGALLLHHSSLNENQEFDKQDEIFPMDNEPDHDALCALEQQFLLKAIQENQDISKHMQDAVNSLKVVLAADQSVKTGQTIFL